MVNKYLEYQVEDHGNEKIYRITWQSRPIVTRAYIKIRNLIMRSSDYGIITEKEKSVTKKILEKINLHYKSNVTIAQYISIRNVIIKQKIIQNHHILASKIDDVRDEYNRGVDIVKLSRKYDFPPSNLLKNILLANGLCKDKISAIFRNKLDPVKYLSGRDMEQFEYAENNDVNSVSNQVVGAKVAFDNETLAVNYFRDIGIKCKTQYDLADEQMEQYGKVIITPDILFIDPVYINGTRIYWVDYKNYVGTDIKFIYGSNNEQAKKYNKKFGPGAMCYRHSFVDNVMIPQTMLLSADAIDVAYR